MNTKEFLQSGKEFRSRLKELQSFAKTVQNKLEIIQKSDDYNNKRDKVNDSINKMLGYYLKNRSKPHILLERQGWTPRIALTRSGIHFWRHRDETMNFLEAKMPGILSFSNPTFSYGRDYINSDISIDINLFKEQYHNDIKEVMTALQELVNTGKGQTWRDDRLGSKENIWFTIDHNDIKFTAYNSRWSQGREIYFQYKQYRKDIESLYGWEDLDAVLSRHQDPEKFLNTIFEGVSLVVAEIKTRSRQIDGLLTIIEKKLAPFEMIKKLKERV